ncbi:hypothetical protein SAMN04487905_107141 [Actinopolyspora xinjiangensis]|uniref:Uncharacterized protein n=1 Tax=Actinopolyspora xinjiangensis TaxID=405564 RepID=A0A1H0UTG1_9ACTN|nr:hypothetical protein [Actinopolyspora xinjiangensis]SDP69502.1 hypothetical protein SAMN04487905_107141 [Actinopolyspora xinjiangensis]
MTDPFLESIAAALAGQAAATLSSAGASALRKVRELVRGKSEADPRTEAALEAAEDRPPEHPKVTALAERLERLESEDPEFGERLRDAGDPVHQELRASGNRTVNQFNGNAHNVVQGERFDRIEFNG